MRVVTSAPPPTIVTRENLEEARNACINYRWGLGVDTETLGKGYLKTRDKVLCLSLCPNEDTRFFVPRELVDEFKDILEDVTIPKIIANAKFDAHRLANRGIKLAGPWIDTVVLDFLYDEDEGENQHGLKDCALRHLGLPVPTYKKLFGKDQPALFTPAHPRWDLWVDYASLDAWLHYKVGMWLSQQLNAIRKWEDARDTLWGHYWEDEEPQLKTLFEMERRGVPVDKDQILDLQRDLQARLDEVARQLNKLVKRPFNPGSAAQKAEYLFGDPALGNLGLEPLSYTDGGMPQTDERTISFFANEGVEACVLLGEYSDISKALGTYCKGMLKHIDPRTERIHTGYTVTLVTGRLSSSDPNLQNIPNPDKDVRKIRRIFVEKDPDYVLIDCDYGQLEMRILAELSGDEVLRLAIKGGQDLHSFTAARINHMTYEEFVALLDRLKAYEKAKAKAKEAGAAPPPKPEDYEGEGGLLWAKDQRNRAKAVGFGLIYGKTAYGLAKDWNVSKEAAQEFIDLWLNTFPGVRRWIHNTQAGARQNKYVQTIRGRFRRLSALKSTDERIRQRALRQCTNACIQGSAADIVKRAMVRINNDVRLKELGFELLHQIHDELLGRGPIKHLEEIEDIIQGIMEMPFSQATDTPLDAVPSHGRSWVDAK